MNPVPTHTSAQIDGVLLMDAIFQLQMLLEEERIPLPDNPVDAQNCFILQDPVTIDAYDAFESLDVDQWPKRMCELLFHGASVHAPHVDIRAAALGVMRAFAPRIPGAADRVLVAVESDSELWIRQYLAPSLPDLARIGSLVGIVQLHDRLEKLARDDDESIAVAAFLALLIVDPQHPIANDATLTLRIGHAARDVMQASREEPGHLAPSFPLFVDHEFDSGQTIAHRRLAMAFAHASDEPWFQQTIQTAIQAADPRVNPILIPMARRNSQRA